MTTEVVQGADPARWLEALGKVPHDAYHLPGWALAEEALQPGVAMAVIASTGSATCVVPFLSRPLPGGEGWDAISPYGYSGPVWSRNLTDNIKGQLLSMALDRMAHDGAVTFFIRTHPILDDTWEIEALGVLPVDHGPTVVVDLNTTEEQRWKQIRPGHRADIRRARDAGCTLELDAGLENLEAFAHLYRATMNRIGADKSYLFSDGYFDVLRSTLQGNLLLGVVRLHGEIVGGALFTLAPSVRGVGYHLSAASPLPGNLQPTKFLIADVADWAAREGYSWMHLGGGLGAAEDSLFRFKRGFSSERRLFRTLRVVLDPVRYSALSGRSAISEGSDYFPAYRNPHNSEVSL